MCNVFFKILELLKSGITRLMDVNTFFAIQHKILKHQRISKSINALRNVVMYIVQ